MKSITKPTIFIVEDDQALQEVYDYTLEMKDNEFDVCIFDHGTDFFYALKNETPDLVILDVMLPGVYDGFEILERLKSNKKTVNIPVIMISAKGDENAKVKGLNLGASDYLAKPFGVCEFVARVKAHLRKDTKIDVDAMVYKDININVKECKTIINNTSLISSLESFKLLYLLCENAGKVLGRSDILKNLWGEGFTGDTDIVDRHIKRLQKELIEAESEVVIQKVRGVGYMLA